MAAMTETELLDRVRGLRQRGRSPKEIARGLHLPPSKVRPLIAALAAEQADDPPPLVGCWVSAGWDEGGLACVLVARAPRYGRVSCCCYLVDTWLLGVKDALGPVTMHAAKLPELRARCFAGFDEPPVPAAMELAGHLVWGGVDYARSLGFEPHPDFAAAAGHLDRPASPCPITFGKDGRPFYVEGPFDDPERIIGALTRTARERDLNFVPAAAG